jgi:hypothetical protein
MAMQMRISIWINIVFLLTALGGCRRSESTSDCFGASSPVDLTIVNDCGCSMRVNLYKYSVASDFRIVHSLEMKSEESRTLCIENEGSIADGVYIKTVFGTKLIRLTYGEDFMLNLCDSLFLIKDIESLNANSSE